MGIFEVSCSIATGPNILRLPAIELTVPALPILSIPLFYTFASLTIIGSVPSMETFLLCLGL